MTTKELYRHKFTGGIYELICTATHLPSKAYELVVYRNIETGEIWARNREMFFDGRFGRFEMVESGEVEVPASHVPEADFGDIEQLKNDNRIARDLERTAMGDGYYGKSLYEAMDMPQTTKKDREMLHRYMCGSNLKTDHVKLQDLAMRIYADPPAAQRKWVGLTDKQMVDAIEPLYLNRSISEMAAEVSMADFRAIEARLKELNNG